MYWEHYGDRSTNMRFREFINEAIRTLIMGKFYNFQWAQKKGELLVEALHAYNDQDLMLGKYSFKEPFAVKVSEGKKLYDILHFHDPFNFAISERVYKLLKESGITWMERL